MKESSVEKIEVDKDRASNSEVKMEDDKIEEGDYFEDCNYINVTT